MNDPQQAHDHDELCAFSFQKVVWLAVLRYPSINKRSKWYAKAWPIEDWLLWYLRGWRSVTAHAFQLLLLGRLPLTFKSLLYVSKELFGIWSSCQRYAGPWKWRMAKYLQCCCPNGRNRHIFCSRYSAIFLCSIAEPSARPEVSPFRVISNTHPGRWMDRFLDRFARCADWRLSNDSYTLPLDFLPNNGAEIVPLFPEELPRMSSKDT